MVLQALRCGILELRGPQQGILSYHLSQFISPLLLGMDRRLISLNLGRPLELPWAMLLGHLVSIAPA
jgi:hypothetical protein